jgi:hypothetical protein
MSGVKDTTKEAPATTEKNRRRRLEVYGCAVGKTSENQRNVIGIIEAEANANLAHKEPQAEPAYDDTKPLLRVQAATAKEKRAK